MKNTVASKPRSKKNSDNDEDRSEKKRKKIKSSKKSRRRRRDSSLASFSSDSDDGPRARRKRAKKLEKRKKESKNPDKKSKKRKKSSRKARHRGVSSSSSYSSRSCSTCRSRSRSPGRSVSRSPSRKGKSRRRNREDGVEERGRNRQRTVNYDLEDARYRSQSCSSCGRSASRSPSRRGTHRGGDKYEEIEKARSPRSALAVAAEGQAVQVRTDGKVEQRDRIIHAYDDFDRYDSRRDSDNYREALERNSLQDATKGAGSTHHDDGEAGFNQTDENLLGNANVYDGNFNWRKNLGGSESVDLETQLRIKALENLKKFRRSLSANTRSDSYQENDSTETLCHKDTVGATTAQDVVESLDGKLANKDTVGATTAQDVVESLDGKLASPFEKHESLDKEVWHAKPRLRSVINIPAERDTSSCVISHQSSSDSNRKLEKCAPDNSIGDSGNPQLLKRTEESSDKTFLQLASTKEKQERQSEAETGGSIADDSAVNQADAQPSSGLSTHHEMESGMGKEEENPGSQFQQKTFSRMHDGELVQVSYKVYIPKKRPALERRQLQR